MIFSLFARPKSRQFELLAGKRVYAIGDIHGRLDLLDRLLAEIERDNAARPALDTTIIFLGDLVDRGPDSAGVVRRVRDLCEAGAAHLLKGNHEEMLILAARGDAAAARGLMKVGGLETLLSYGISKEETEHGSFSDLADLISARVDAADIVFLESAENYILLGDYLFVHAGIRPGVPIDAQEPNDLRWIRTAFTTSRRDHGLMVVHGHTITEEVEVRSNRIGLDTGAFASGRLSALGIEGAEHWILST